MAVSPQAPSATQAASRLKEQEAQRLIQLRGASLFAPTNPSPVVAYKFCPSWSSQDSALHAVLLQTCNVPFCITHWSKAKLHGHVWGSGMAPDPPTYPSPACCWEHVQPLCLPVRLIALMAYTTVKLSSIIQSIILSFNVCVLVRIRCSPS